MLITRVDSLSTIIPSLSVVAVVICLLIVQRLIRLKDKRYCVKLASYLQDSSIAYPNLFSPSFYSYERVTGLYKNRKIEFRFVFSSAVSQLGVSGIEIKMRPNLTSYEERGINLTNDQRLEDNWVFWTGMNIFEDWGKEEKIPKILEELYHKTIEYEESLVVNCLECGEKIGKDSDKCLKCGWTWK